MREHGYRLVQVWVNDEEQARYIKAIEAGSKVPHHRFRWESERVVLEIHKKSVDIASREHIYYSYFSKLLLSILEAYKSKSISRYVYWDIVELLRPIIGEDLYRQFKVGRPRARRYSKVFQALFGKSMEQFMADLLRDDGFDIDLDVDF